MLQQPECMMGNERHLSAFEVAAFSSLPSGICCIAGEIPERKYMRSS